MTREEKIRQAQHEILSKPKPAPAPQPPPSPPETPKGYGWGV